MPFPDQVNTQKNKFFIKQNDTLPNISIQLITRDCLGSLQPFNLSGVTAVTFDMSYTNGSSAIVSGSSSITSYTGGTVAYNWQIGDTSVAGNYFAEFELAFSDGTYMSVPQIGPIYVQVGENINRFET